MNTQKEMVKQQVLSDEFDLGLNNVLAQYQEYTTLVIPPLGELRDDPLTGRGPNCAGEAG